jgi:putative Holliday junction resolvase
MRLMALDIGERRIGIAISESGILATPYQVLLRQTKNQDFTRLNRLITDLKIERIIIGLPYSLSAEQKMGPQARRVKRYGDALAKAVSVPCEYFDESYSTVDANAYLSATGQKKIPLDAAAAAVILQSYLDMTRD